MCVSEPVCTLLAVEGHVEVPAPVREGEVLGSAQGGAQQVGAGDAQWEALVRVPRVTLAHLAVEELLLVLEHHTNTNAGTSSHMTETWTAWW